MPLLHRFLSQWYSDFCNCSLPYPFSHPVYSAIPETLKPTAFIFSRSVFFIFNRHWLRSISSILPISFTSFFSLSSLKRSSTTSLGTTLTITLPHTYSFVLSFYLLPAFSFHHHHLAIESSLYCYHQNLAPLSSPASALTIAASIGVRGRRKLRGMEDVFYYYMAFHYWDSLLSSYSSHFSTPTPSLPHLSILHLTTWRWCRKVV